jgi:hypothetical protein
MLAVHKKISIIILSLIILSLFYCSQSFLSNCFICDDYDYNSKNCINHQNPLIIRGDFNQTLKDFSYDLYFHQKITLGIMLKNADKNKNFQCNYKVIGNTIYENTLEGNRWLKNHFWCFDYLGTMILNYYKSNQQEEKFLKDLFNKNDKIKIELILLDNQEIKKIFKREIRIENLY